MFEPLVQQIKELEAEISALQAQREELRNQVIAELTAIGKSYAEVKIGKEEYILSKKSVAEISYNEVLLKERLKERFSSILQVDYRKIKKNLHAVRNYLMPIIETIGSVNKDLVKAGIKVGALSKKDFAGAFTKTEKEILFIKNQRYRHNSNETR